MNEDYTEIMVDIETVGAPPTGAIVAIAAVAYKMDTGDVIDEFYEKVSLDSCLSAGLTVDEDTLINFWMLNTTPKAKEETFRGMKYTLKESLTSLSKFILSQKNIRIWCLHNSFDFAILKNAYTALDMALPWSHTKEMDIATLRAIQPEALLSVEREGVYHNALADCHYQIKWQRKIYLNIIESLDAFKPKTMDLERYNEIVYNENTYNGKHKISEEFYEQRLSCPKCNEGEMLVNSSAPMETIPPKIRVKCDKCGFTSGKYIKSE